MRYQQLSAELYTGARNRFASHMQKGGVAVFCSSDVYPTSADGHFAFKQCFHPGWDRLRPFWSPMDKDKIYRARDMPSLRKRGHRFERIGVYVTCGRGTGSHYRNGHPIGGDGWLVGFCSYLRVPGDGGAGSRSGKD